MRERLARSAESQACPGTAHLKSPDRGLIVTFEIQHLAPFTVGILWRGFSAAVPTPAQVQRASWNHFLKAYGRHTEWVSFADVDEYFQLNDTHADTLESGAASLADVLDAETRTAMPVCVRTGAMAPLSY